MLQVSNSIASCEASGFNVSVKNTWVCCPDLKVEKHVSHRPSKYFDSTLHP